LISQEFQEFKWAAYYAIYTNPSLSCKK